MTINKRAWWVHGVELKIQETWFGGLSVSSGEDQPRGPFTIWRCRLLWQLSHKSVQSNGQDNSVTCLGLEMLKEQLCEVFKMRVVSILPILQVEGTINKPIEDGRGLSRMW